MTTRGIPEVPITQPRIIIGKDGTRHSINEFTPQHRDFLVQLRQMVIQLTGTQSAMVPPSNLTIKGQGLSNLIQFSRVSNGDYYEVAHALTSSLNDPHLVITDIGNSQSWADTIGSSAVAKFYWVRARKNTGLASEWSGPVTATTSVATVGVPPATPPPASNIIVIDQNTGNRLPYRLEREK